MNTTHFEMAFIRRCLTNGQEEALEIFFLPYEEDALQKRRLELAETSYIAEYSIVNAPYIMMLMAQGWEMRCASFDGFIYVSIEMAGNAIHQHVARGRDVSDAVQHLNQHLGQFMLMNSEPRGNG